MTVGIEGLVEEEGEEKGEPKYDPRPFTITSLHDKPLQRGNKKLRRETQKFKIFFEANQPTTPKQRPQSSGHIRDNDWEEKTVEDDWTNQDTQSQQTPRPPVATFLDISRRVHISGLCYVKVTDGNQPKTAPPSPKHPKHLHPARNTSKHLTLAPNTST